MFGSAAERVQELSGCQGGGTVFGLAVKVIIQASHGCVRPRQAVEAAARKQMHSDPNTHACARVVYAQ